MSNSQMQMLMACVRWKSSLPFFIQRSASVAMIAPYTQHCVPTRLQFGSVAYMQYCLENQEKLIKPTRQRFCLATAPKLAADGGEMQCKMGDAIHSPQSPRHASSYTVLPVHSTSSVDVIEVPSILILFQFSFILTKVLYMTIIYCKAGFVKV